MKILFLSELFYPHGSGGELATYLYSKLLSTAGNKITIVTNKFQGESSFSRYDGLQIYRLPLFKGNETDKYSLLRRFDIIFSSFFRKLLKWADVVYIPRFWYSAIILAKAYGKPVVTHLHGYLPICSLATTYNFSKQEICRSKIGGCSRCIYLYERDSGKKLQKSFESLTLNSMIGPCFGQVAKLSDAMICVSEAQRKLIATKAPSLKTKMQVVYNPLPKLPFSEIKGDAFGYFGGQSLLKGFDTLCKAIKFQHTHWKDNHLKVYATNLDLTIHKLKSIEQLGIIPYKRLDMHDYEKLYSIIRGVVVPSVWPETFGYVAAEALLRGRMVIGAEVCGIPEVLEGCPGSWLFPVDDYRRLAEILVTVKNLNKEAIENLGIQNRETVQKKFSDDKILKMFVDVLTKITD